MAENDKIPTRSQRNRTELVAEARGFARRQMFEYDNWGDVPARERSALLIDLADAIDVLTEANTSLGYEMLGYVYHPQYEMGFNDGAKAMRDRFATMGVNDVDDDD